MLFGHNITKTARCSGTIDFITSKFVNYVMQMATHTAGKHGVCASSTGAQGRKPSVEAVRNSFYPPNLVLSHFRPGMHVIM